MTQSSTPRSRERTISFRLSRHYCDLLLARATDNGMSAGQYARLALCMHFEDAALHKLADEIRQLRGEVTDLRIEQALGKRAA